MYPLCIHFESSNKFCLNPEHKYIVAVLRVIEQKGLPKKCQVLAKAVARQSKALKNLQEAAESRDTVSTSIDVTACKVEIE